MTWHNIPKELQILTQWACSGPDKVPLNPRTGQAADPTDPTTWGTFDEACRSGYQHIGFMLSPFDPYVVIDLDDPLKLEKRGEEAVAKASALNKKILNAFPSYTELSQSGKGAHIVCKGAIAQGCRRDTVELYGAYRYMIFTGNVIKNFPIVDCDYLINVLYDEIKGDRLRETPELTQVESHLSDEQVYNMGSTATNADKFNDLWFGRIGGYPSQSEADFALLSMLAFYTPDNEQVRRLFRYSSLGKREKAQKDNRYMDLSLRQIRAKQPPLIDLTALKRTIEEPLFDPTPDLDEETEEMELPPIHSPQLDFPPGIVGAIARYIYSTSTRPVPEIALAAAIALTAGIIGRSYNVSGTGLNQYLILLAKTGTGKEGAVTGIDKLLSTIRPQVPMVDQFIGPGAFASGQALIRVLDDRPCFISVLGEFGLTLQQLCSPNAQPGQVMLKRVLLDLYAKSGAVQVLRSSVYSDSEKNTKQITAPCVTLLGEATPETFFEGLDVHHIAEGLIPRFTIIEYTGGRPARNPNTNQPPDPELCRQLIELVTISLTTQNNRTCAQVPLDQHAQVIMDRFDTECDNHINSAGSEVETQLWNRAHLKALKLAALLAVGCNPLQPFIDEHLAQWAISFIRKDVGIMLRRFADGDIGTGDHRQEADVRRAISAYLNMSKRKRAQYKVSPKIIELPVIPYHYLRRRLKLYASFKNDRRGANRALEDTLRMLVKSDALKLVPVYQARAEYGMASELYCLGDTW